MDWIQECWGRLDKKLSRTAVTSYDKIPYTTENGVHDNMMKKDKSWWTNGFWPALMILMYSATGKEQYLKTARHGMDLLDDALFTYDGLHHDVGFMWNISAGVDYRITGDTKARNRFLVAVNHMMGRYNCDGEFFRAWNGKRDKAGWAIIDCMMNIPLLYRASAELEDERFSMAARHHADKTMKYHIRPDGSCNHINEYNPITGEFVKAYGGQGYDENSSWTRGQAWGIYGFALSYRYTKNPAYLDTAKRIADYFIENAGASDWRVLCDFKQPKVPVIYDSTAAAIAACGLLEIAESASDNEKEQYTFAAVKLVKMLYDEFCDWTENNDSVLQKGTEAYTGGIHIPIIYGDYFFTEAVYRLMGYDSKILW